MCFKLLFEVTNSYLHVTPHDEARSTLSARQCKGYDIYQYLKAIERTVVGIPWKFRNISCVFFFGTMAHSIYDVQL